MTDQSDKKYTHYDQYVDHSVGVVSGAGERAQRYLHGTVNKWVKPTRFDNEKDEKYVARCKSEQLFLSKYQSHLLLSEGGDVASGRLIAVVAERPAIGYSWQTVLPHEDECPVSLSEAKCIAIYLNSTVGRIQMRARASRKVEYPQYAPIAFEDIPLPDVSQEIVLDTLVRCFDETCKEIVPQFRNGRTEIREKWDDAVSKALDINRNAIAQLADMISRDAAVNKQAFFAQR